MRCLGYKKVSFKTQDTNTEISGYRCTFVDEYDSAVGVGFSADTPFLSDEKFSKFKIADLTKSNLEFDVFYNRYGKIQEIRTR